MLMFWVIAVVLCLATIAALVAVKMPVSGMAFEHREGALAIYKDQLIELERDVVSGVLGADEAEAQRTEISRRLLVVSREQAKSKAVTQNFPKYAVFTIPLLASLLYYQIGHYGLGDVPRAERLAAAETSNDWPALIARVEDQLDKNPNDVEGWRLLVPNYLNLGRYGDAARAMIRIAEISGATPELYANIAEALIAENKGLITERSLVFANEALKLDSKYPKALYFSALGLAQQGKKDEAKAAFSEMLAFAPADALWRPAVEKEIAKLQQSATAPQISSEQMQSADGMTAEDRNAMINGMVDGLAEKLKANPDDIEGWLRLIRARTVLKESDLASSALATARNTFATKPEQLKALDVLANELNLK